MSVTRKTTPHQIIVWWKDHQYGDLPYQSARCVLHKILDDNKDEQAHQFTLLPLYSRQILSSDPGSTVKLKFVDNRFSSIFISPSYARDAWPHLRSLICVDAAFTKTLHDYVLIIATGIDANSSGLNLAWGIAPKENEEHWRWFLTNLCDALPGLNQSATVIMSDGRKDSTRPSCSSFLKQHKPSAASISNAI